MSPRFPFDPFPVGWYVLDVADGVQPGQARAETFCGQECVLWRTADGTPYLHKAWCPHLGAHLGKGGTVRGDQLVCPFHHFEFEGGGACTRTPYGKTPPKRARLEGFPIIQRNGLLIAWWHPEGEPPSFEVPTHPMEGWTRLRTRAWPLRSHPQETNENAVDIGHFSVVHGYRDVGVDQDFTADGPTFTAAYSMTRTSKLAGIPVGAVRTNFIAHGFGLGYSFVEAFAKKFGFESRHYVFATPRDGDHITLRIGNQIRITHPMLPGFLSRLLANLLAAPIFEEYAADVRQDWEIWENKVYVHPPALAAGDGPVGRFRQWCRQFYPSPERADLAAR